MLYLSNDELKALAVPKNELWRVVRFEVSTDNGWISWLHEREWRCPDRFKLPGSIQAAFVRTTAEAAELSAEIQKKPKSFKCIPKSIIPMTVLCQGLLK